MDIRWTQNLKTDEEKQEFKKRLLGAKYVLDRLKTIADQNEESLGRQEVSPTSYDSPNWAYRQAHANGYRQCLNIYRQLLTLDPKDFTNE